MLLFLELATLAAFLASAWHARRRLGAEGLWLFGSLLWLGLVRENFVVLRDLLYGWAPLTLELGWAPMIAVLVWGFSIWAAAVWAEAVNSPIEAAGLRAGRPPSSARHLALIALFMVALACFYEPLVARVGMARWEPGTRSTAGVPWITLVGYPSLAVPFLALHGALVRRLHRPAPRAAALAVAVAALAVAHAWGLGALKAALGW